MGTHTALSRKPSSRSARRAGNATNQYLPRTVLSPCQPRLFHVEHAAALPTVLLGGRGRRADADVAYGVCPTLNLSQGGLQVIYGLAIFTTMLLSNAAGCRVT